MNKMLSFNEIGLIPAEISNINSRKQVNPFTNDGHLPVFVSPMTCILDRNNFKIFQDSKVIPIYPIWYNENLKFEDPTIGRGWISCSLTEFAYWFGSGNAEENVPQGFYKILIDCANGHMESIYSEVKDAKQKYNNKLVVMIGNIANPTTYLYCCKAGVDFVRIGIGGGCFIPGQKVILANEEEKNIENVKVGDMVKTHTGEFHKVEETHCYTRDETLYNINGIKCTANHEFYVINISDEEKITEENLSEFAYWLPANQLDINLHRLIEL